MNEENNPYSPDYDLTHGDKHVVKSLTELWQSAVLRGAPEIISDERAQIELEASDLGPRPINYRRQIIYNEALRRLGE
jgi:hypothetical protein